MNEKSFVMKVLGMWASELDSAGLFEAADGVDVVLEDLCVGKESEGEVDSQVSKRMWGAAMDFLNHHNVDMTDVDLEQIHKAVEESTEDFLEEFEEYYLNQKENDIDDGRFGLNDPLNPVAKAAALANSLDQAGLFAEADLIDNRLLKEGEGVLSPQEAAYSLYRILMHLQQRAGPENQASFLNNLRKGLAKVNAIDIASKKPNPAAAVGAAVNIIKNILMGQDPTVISTTIMELQRMV